MRKTNHFAALFSGATIVAAAGGLAIALAATPARSDNPPPGDAVGAIEGEAIAVNGPMSVDTVNGQVVTILHSGNDIRVKSGTARISLVEGGQIAICGPAHLSVLKSGNSLTIALDNGTIHVRIESGPSLKLYTPQIQAQPVAIGAGPQDTVIGFDAAGAMCVRTNRGALRLEQQLTGQSVLVPQGGDVTIAGGQLDSLRTVSGGHCSCEPQIAAAPPPQISHLATAEEVRREYKNVKPELPKSDSKIVQAPKPAPEDGPVYQVFVPPLIFDATARVQPRIDPSMIVLVRRVRVRPTLIFRGKVEGDLVATNATAPAVPSPAALQTVPAPASVHNNDSVVQRVRNFMRKLWPGGS
jgi:hypothetical protein